MLSSLWFCAFITQWRFKASRYSNGTGHLLELAVSFAELEEHFEFAFKARLISAERVIFVKSGDFVDLAAFSSISTPRLLHGRTTPLISIFTSVKEVQGRVYEYNSTKAVLKFSSFSVSSLCTFSFSRFTTKILGLANRNPGDRDDKVIIFFSKELSCHGCQWFVQWYY